MDREKVIDNLRATLMSSKGGVNIEEVNRDFKTLIGEPIPFKKLGYPSLESFLQTVPGIKISSRGGQSYVEVQPTQKSAHLIKLISHQKTTTKKKKGSYKNITPYRMPHSTKKIIYPGKPVNENSSTNSMYRFQNALKRNNSQRTGRIPPLMEMQIPAPSERPRYMQPISGTPTSPTKKLKERQTNNSVHVSPNRADNTAIRGSEKPVTPVITKPKTGGNQYISNLSDRLKIAVEITPPVIHQSERSHKSEQSDILSPLSPAQLIGNNKHVLFSPNKFFNTAQENIHKKTVPVSLEDPRHLLQMSAQRHNLPEPVYRISKAKSMKDIVTYAHVKIGPHGYSSYPQEAHSDEEAQKLAAQVALKDLTEKLGSLANVSETTDRKLIQERILAIIDNHPNGIFHHQIPIYYKNQHNEILPLNWLNIVETCSAIVLEKGADNSTILQRRNTQTEKKYEQLSPKKDKIELSPIGPVVPGHLKLPDDKIWIVHVRCVWSTIDVWVRLVGAEYSDKFDELSSEMMDYYSQIRTPAKVIEVGSYYAIQEDECWHRVRCEEIDMNNGLATVLFIDHGDDGERPCSSLYPLDKKFCSLPAQAMRICLAGLEDFCECETVVPIIEEHLFDQTFYVEVLNHGVDKDGPYAFCEFYDTSGPDDINVNKLLYKKITHNVISLPKLDNVGQVIEAFVSHVDKNGDVYIQIQTEGMKYLVHLLNRFIQNVLSVELLKNNTVATLDKMKTYLVKVEENWYRGKVVELCPNNQVKMFLMDFGKIVLVNKINLIYLEKLSEVLAKYPAQALKVHLHNIETSMFNEKMVARLIKLAPHGDPILVKIVSHSNSDVPIVELFKRIQPDNVLASINLTLAFEQINRSNGDNNNNTKPRKRVERMTSRVSTYEDDDVIRTLKPPNIAMKDYFDVHVTMAAHPGNFTVQPLDDKQALEAMMIKLQEACNAYNGPHPTIETIKEGKLYAAKHIDEHWYRVCVSNIISENMVTVYFCDFGDVSILSLENLQPLRSQFFELPYQAIKARLVGIKPINMDWSVEDCLRFQKLVLDRNFVSEVKESSQDDLNPANTILGLELIDVDTNDDIYIHKVLVTEGRAVLINP